LEIVWDHLQLGVWYYRNHAQAWTDPEEFRRWRPQNFYTIGTWKWQGCQPYTPVPFTGWV